jgi:hypothetical protein
MKFHAGHHMSSIVLILSAHSCARAAIFIVKRRSGTMGKGHVVKPSMTVGASTLAGVRALIPVSGGIGPRFHKITRSNWHASLRAPSGLRRGHCVQLLDPRPMDIEGASCTAHEFRFRQTLATAKLSFS